MGDSKSQSRDSSLSLRDQADDARDWEERESDKETPPEASPPELPVQAPALSHPLPQTFYDNPDLLIKALDMIVKLTTDPKTKTRLMALYPVAFSMGIELTVRSTASPRLPFLIALFNASYALGVLEGQKMSAHSETSDPSMYG